MRWIDRFRIRAIAWVLGIALCALATISLTTIPAWPVVGVAIAVAAMAVNSVAARLDAPACLACGHSTLEQPVGEHGVVCPACGAVNDRPAHLVASDIPRQGDDQISA